MKEFIGTVDAAQPDQLTPEMAEQLGLQMGMVIVAGLIGGEFHRYVGSAVEVNKQTEHYEVFKKSLLKIVEEGLQSGLPGISTRAGISRHLHAGTLALREQLDSVSLEEGEKDIGVIDGLLETSQLLERAADFLREPIEENIRNLCDDAKKLQVAQEMRKAHQNAVMDHVRDSVECNDPDCQIHKTH
jgi:hypothetical protein